MAKFELHYSLLVQEFYTVEIESDSEAEARAYFSSIPANDLDFNDFDDSVVVNIHIEKVIEIIDEETN